MDASAVSSPPHSQENPPKHSGGGRGEAPAEEIGGEAAAAAADDFMFADDTFPSLPDFPCLSSPSSSTYSSSSSSNSSSTYTNNAAAGGVRAAGGEPSERASGGEGFDALEDIDQLLDFASLSVPWDSEPLFPDVGMMIEDAMSAPPHPVGAGGPDGRAHGKALLEGAGGEEACMDAAGEDLPRFFMEWLTSNRESISAEDLRGIRLKRSTIEAAAARLGGGRQGTMKLLKLILTWVQNHHLQKKRPRDAMEEAAVAAGGSHGHGHGQLSSPGVNSGYEFPSGGHDAGTSWVPYQQPFSPPAAYGGGDAVYPSGSAGHGGQFTFHQQGCGATSSVAVNSQPFSPPAVGDMHAPSGGGTMSWPPQQYVTFAGASSTGSYPLPPVVPPPPFSPGFGAGQYPMGSPRMVAGVEASATKEARKKRMARQRRLSCLQQQRSQQLSLGQIQSALPQQEPSPRSVHSAPVTPSAGNWGFWLSTGQPQIRNPLSKSNSSTPVLQVPSPEAVAAPPPPPPKTPASSARQEENPQRAAASEKRQGTKAEKNLRFLLQKVLKQSDVGSLGRIVLPKKEAEIHLPELKTRDGVSIPMEDIGSSRVWNMKYRFWPNNKSRMYLLENTGDFVRYNELQEGDFIVIYSDVKSGKYTMSVVGLCGTLASGNRLNFIKRLIRGVKVRPAQENGNGVLGKHKHGCPERAGASGSEDGGGVDACKSRPSHSVRRARQEAAAMGQMALSI